MTTQQAYRPLLNALAHPMRFRILLAMDRRGEAAASDLARELGATPQRITHHLNYLEEHQAIELVRTEEVPRGTKKKYYRRIARPWVSDEEYEQMSEEDRRGVLGPAVMEMLSEIVLAVDGSELVGRTDSHVSRTVLHLDHQGWEEMRNLLSETLEEALDILTSTANRLAERPDAPTINARLAMLLFEAPSR
jgi:DNA-binding transcriptional ArsR family regulator